ncbi:MAG: hypothetical protein AAFV28_02015 [Cyanobacteria bacterium J06635_13]
MLDPISHQHGYGWLLNKSQFFGNGNRTLKTSFLLLSAIAMLLPGLAAEAEIIEGKIASYSPEDRQAVIDLGEEDGIGKHDQGKIKLTSLDNPNVEFIGANIVVVSVEENSAVVSVKEAPGVQIPIQSGAAVTVDTESGIARREEEAKIIAAQQAEEARRQQQLEEARAEKARREREQEEARAAELRRQRELEEARIQETRRQQQIEIQRAEAARRQREIEEARQSQPEPIVTGQIKPEPESEPEASQSTDLAEAKELWRSNSDSNINSADLPEDYLQAYTAAREQPSPETHYRFAEVLINYEITDRALTWLDETESRFPETQPVNNLYRAVALIQQGKVKQSQNILTLTELPEDPIIDEFKSYLYTQKGQWDQVSEVFQESESAVIYNNRLIALYCIEAFNFERETDLTPKDCPFGDVARRSPEEWDDLDDDEIEAIIEAYDRRRETIAKVGKQALAAYPEDPYLLNTMGFIALQLEDYEMAYERYQELATVLNRYDTVPPRFQSLKANAIKYVSNYDQNYDFLAQNSVDLDSMRSDRNSLNDAIIIGGAGSIITSAVTNDISPVGLIGGLLATFLRYNNSRSRVRDIEQERNSVLDQMYTTFTADLDLVAAPPSLEADSLLSLNFSPTQPIPEPLPANPATNSNPVAEPSPNTTPPNPSLRSDSPEVEQKMREFDEFWKNN